MHDIALALSIISSVLIIIYLVGLIFGRKKPDDEIKITIRGRIVTETITTTTVVEGDEQAQGRVVEGQVVQPRPPNLLNP